MCRPPKKQGCFCISVTAAGQRWTGQVRSGVLAVLDQAIASSTNFLTLVLIARLCTDHELGIYALGWSAFCFLKTAQDRTLAAPYLILAHRADRDATTLLGSSLVHQLVFGSLCSVALGLMASVFAWIGEPRELAVLLAVMIAAVPMLLLRDHLRAVFCAHFRYHAALAMNVQVCLLQLGGLGILIWCGWLTVSRAFAILGLASLIPATVWLMSRPQPYRFVRSEILGHWRSSWSYARWLFAARTLGIAGYFLIPWIIVWIISEPAAGIYATCANLVGLSMMFVMGINNFLQPRAILAFQRGGARALRRSLAETAGVFAVILSALCVLYYCAGGWLLARIYGAEFGGHGMVVFVLSISVLFASLALAAGNGLAAIGRPEGNLWGESCRFLVSIVLALVLISRWQLVGAGAALIGGDVLGAIVTAATLMRFLKTESESPAPAAVGSGEG